MRSIANTNITFGPLINIPVKMYSAVDEHQLRFNYLHKHDDGSVSRISMPCVCDDCGEVVPRGLLDRGLERGDESILITADEFAQCEDESGKDFKVLHFIHADDMNPMMYGLPYYLEPDLGMTRNRPNTARNPRAPETYMTLWTVLNETRQMAVVNYTSRGKTHLAVLRAQGDKLVIQNILWPDELRQPEFATLQNVTVDPEAVKLMKVLVEQRQTDFASEEYVDTYAVAINEMVDAKVEGVQLSPREETEAAEDVSDLLAALQASIAAHPAGKARQQQVSA
jgi:DNA end-binding protein Ku